MFTLLISLYSFVYLTGDFKTDIKMLQNCSTLNQIIMEHKDSVKQMTPYQKKLRDHLTPWYRKNCRA